MSRNICPCCGARINYLKKLLFFSSVYGKPCSSCGKILKIKPLSYIAGIGIFVFIVILRLLFRNNIVLVKCIPIFYHLFCFIALYFVKLYPDED